VNRLNVLIALLPVALAGCGGTSLSGTASLTPEQAGGDSGASAYPVSTAESTASNSGGERFNPFAIPEGGPPGGREVIANPTSEDILQAGPLPDMAFGRADAPVTIVEYASLTCRFCRAFHKDVFPQLKRELIDTGKVRFILREFPIGKTSGAATIALRCAAPEKYLELYGKYLDQQATWVAQEVRLDPIFKVAAQVGMTRPQFDACRENQSMIDGLKWVKERGRKLGVIGTPNFFVGDKLVKKVLTMDEIRSMVDAQIAARSTAAAN